MVWLETPISQPSRRDQKRPLLRSFAQWLTSKNAYRVRMAENHPGNAAYVDVILWFTPNACSIDVIRMSSSLSLAAWSFGCLEDPEGRAGHRSTSGKRCFPYRGKIARLFVRRSCQKKLVRGP